MGRARHAAHVMCVDFMLGIDMRKARSSAAIVFQEAQAVLRLPCGMMSCKWMQQQNTCAAEDLIHNAYSVL